MMKRCSCLLVLALWCLKSLPVYALGLSSPFGNFSMDHLKIGKSYSLKALLNRSYEVINTGDEPVSIRIQSQVPRPGEIIPNTEPIPDASWIKVGKDDFTVGPSQIAKTDLIITIPNDEKYLGKRYLAMIESRTVSPGSLQVGLRSRLVLDISLTPPSVDELKEKLKRPDLANLSFDISPYETAVENFPLGRKVDLVKEKNLKLKIINPNDAGLTFHVRQTTQLESHFPVPQGVEVGPGDSVVEVGDKGILKVEGNSLKVVPLFLTIPDKKEYRNKSYYYMVKVEVLELEVSTIYVFRMVVKT